MSKKRTWVQAAIDVEDIDLAKRIAFMSLDAGAEWLEIGTPLLYQYGHSAIGFIRKAVGNNAVLVADYKAPFASLCATQAIKQGADFIMVSAGYNDWLLENSINTCREVGIEPIFYITDNQKDIKDQITKLSALGVRYIFSSRYSITRNKDGVIEKLDNMPLLISNKSDCYLGITSDVYEEAKDSVVCGADWITFGMVLRKPEPIICKSWIEMIHTTK